MSLSGLIRLQAPTRKRDLKSSPTSRPSINSSSHPRSMRLEVVRPSVSNNPSITELDTDTVLAHLKAKKLGRFAPTPAKLAHPFSPDPSLTSSITAGARCEVTSGEGGVAKRGTVRYVGEAEIGRRGVWVGVELDEPVGKGDGS